MGGREATWAAGRTAWAVRSGYGRGLAASGLEKKNDKSFPTAKQGEDGPSPRISVLRKSDSTFRVFESRFSRRGVGQEGGNVVQQSITSTIVGCRSRLVKVPN